MSRVIIGNVDRKVTVNVDDLLSTTILMCPRCLQIQYEIVNSVASDKGIRWSSKHLKELDGDRQRLTVRDILFQLWRRDSRRR